jgi:hypothetical protein
MIGPAVARRPGCATDFASVLRDEVELAHVQSALLAAVDPAMGPQGVAMWIRRGSR